MDLKSGDPYRGRKNGLIDAFPLSGADLSCEVVVVDISDALTPDKLAGHGDDVDVRRAGLPGPQIERSPHPLATLFFFAKLVYR